MFGAMYRLLKTFLLLFTLASVAIGGNALAAEPGNIGSAHSKKEQQNYLSVAKLTKSLAIEHAAQEVHFQSPAAPDPADELLRITYACELRSNSALVQYLRFAQVLSHSLKVRDIIFPSHYFW